ncbi:hypothetical protein [Deinococcus detaillensis]|nr:hypothetical protein [Deinococcus detaillensis]
MNYGNVIAHVGREVTIPDLYSYERHVIITIGKLIVQCILDGAWNDGLN